MSQVATSGLASVEASEASWAGKLPSISAAASGGCRRALCAGRGGEFDTKVFTGAAGDAAEGELASGLGAGLLGTGLVAEGATRCVGRGGEAGGATGAASVIAAGGWMGGEAGSATGAAMGGWMGGEAGAASVFWAAGG